MLEIYLQEACIESAENINPKMIVLSFVQLHMSTEGNHAFYVLPKVNVDQ